MLKTSENICTSFTCIYFGLKYLICVHIYMIVLLSLVSIKYAIRYYSTSLLLHLFEVEMKTPRIFHFPWTSIIVFSPSFCSQESINVLLEEKLAITGLVYFFSLDDLFSPCIVGSTGVQGVLLDIIMVMLYFDSGFILW